MMIEPPVFTDIRAEFVDESRILKQQHLNLIGDIGQTTLQEAIANRKIELAEKILDAGVDLDKQDKSGNTALHYALSHGFTDLAIMIADKGANVNIANNHGNGPLWVAVMSAKDGGGVVSTLIALGANPNLYNKAGKSPLDLAKDIGIRSVIEALEINE